MVGLKSGLAEQPVKMNASDKTVQMGDHVFRFEDDPDPGDFFLEIARAELRETPVIREAALQEVKERIASQYIFL